MNVKAKLQLDETRLLFQQSTRCYTNLVNDGDELLENINPNNLKGAAEISLKNIETDKTTLHAKKNLPESEHPVLSLQIGEKLIDTFQLSSLFEFPSCGVYELRAHFEWNEGDVASEPVWVEVQPAKPQFFITETTHGSQIGDIFCVWINKNNERNSLYLSKIDSSDETHFISTNEIAEIPQEVKPALSVAANAIPTRQYCAWILGNKLNYVIYSRGQIQSNVFELDADDYEIIPPLLEDPWDEGVRQFAEVLLLKKGTDSWQMRTVLLGEPPAMSKDVRKVKSVSPQWFRTVYRSTGERFTFILVPLSRDGNPYVKLAMSVWKARTLPTYPVFVTNWQGTLVAADVLLAGDNRIVGAGLVKQHNEEKTEYVIQKWSLDKNDELKLSTLPLLLWNEKWTIEHAILRVNGEGTTFMLVKGGPESKWFWVDGAGEITSLGELSPQINLPANIIFVNFIYPALLYTDKNCGLKLHYLGPKRVYRPPT